MRLFLDGEQLLLDPAPLSAEQLRRKAKFKVRCRHYVEGDGPAGTLALTMPGNAGDFETMSGRLEDVAEALGHTLSIDAELEAQFRAMKELAEEHYRAGNEIKRGDPKYDDKLYAFSDTVNASMVRPLKDRQMRDAFFLATMGRAGNFSVPGSGKTATVLGAFAFLSAQGKVRRLMVVCPKNAFDSWRTEWRLCFGELRPLSCVSTQDEAFKRLGRADRKRFIRASIGAYNLILVNYEAAPGIADELAQVAANDTMLVFDEVHRVKRIGGTQATAALTIAQDAPYTLALTGTPLPNTYEDLYNFLHILYPHEYDSFFGFTRGELARADDEEQLAINARIQPFFCRTTKRDLGVPPASPDKLIEVTADARTDRLMSALKARYRKNKLTLMLRILQMEHDPIDLLDDLDPNDFRWILEEDEETGEVDVVDYSEEIVNMIRSTGMPEKRVRCVRLVRDLVQNGNPVIVWCIFRNSMEGLRRDLASMGIEAHVICGDVILDDRSRVLDDFRAGRFPVLITNPHTLAESVSLHSVCHDAVYYEYSFNLVHLLQSRDRIHRLGLPEGQDTRYYYLCEDYLHKGKPYSMDQQIYERLQMKEQTMLRAIDADLIETQPTTEEDLDAIFAGLFDD